MAQVKHDEVRYAILGRDINKDMLGPVGVHVPEVRGHEFFLAVGHHVRAASAE